MAGVSGVSGSEQIMAQIAQLNNIVEQAVLQRTDFATKLVKLAVTQQVEDTKQTTAQAALDKVI